jgi:hypothetical protein
MRFRPIVWPRWTLGLSPGVSCKGTNIGRTADREIGCGLRQSQAGRLERVRQEFVQALHSIAINLEANMRYPTKLGLRSGLGGQG